MVPDFPAKEDLSQDVHEMETMVTGLLEGARISSPHNALNLEEVSLNQFLQTAVEKFGGSEPSVVLTACPQNVRVTLDKDRMHTVLRNLIQNSLKYSGSGVPVEISARELAGEILFEVRDHGTGIPASELERVFEPFYRVDKSAYPYHGWLRIRT